ncbi:unnamed protein product [Rotaria sp. Silwood1]|nr:unnamed protein product [Rotaria sp. Silwood1]
MKTPIQMNSINIGITDCARYTNYERWFLDAPIKVDVIRLSYNLNNIDDIDKCHGIVLSGGEDVDPRRYKRPDLLGQVEFTDIDEKRDEFEWEVIERALKLQLPILAICRGMQLFNVYQGGTLIFDIPKVTNINGHAKIQGMDQRHEVNVVEESLLNKITGCVKGAVNSSHHQCVETLGKNLSIAAIAEDPIVEAVQYENTQEYPFYLGVQWHPERMVDQDSPFSYNIRQAFLDYITEREKSMAKTQSTEEDDTSENISNHE